jgi:aquaporin Z
MSDRAYIAEIFGTAVLVFIGCGSVTLGGYGVAMPLGVLHIAMAFGLAVMAMAYTIGSVSGAHLNPAVTLSMLMSGRMTLGQAAGYMASQVVGGFLGISVLVGILSILATPVDFTKIGLGQTTYTAAVGAYGAGFIEFIATFIFITVILVVTRDKANSTVAGLVIGLTLTAMILVAGPLTGMSANPARSLAPAIYVKGEAFAQLWTYIVATMGAGFFAGLVERAGLLRK